MLEEKINELKKEIINYALHVESMIEKSFEGLEQREKRLLREVKEEMESKANNLEIEIEENCIKTIAQFEPRAKDLRVILTVLKMNNDLERVGDHAVKISNCSLFLIDNFSFELPVIIKEMKNRTMDMLKMSIDSFVNEDSDKAKHVCEADDEIDSRRDKVIKEIIPGMCREPDTVDRDMHLIRIAKSIERVADLSTNISEDIIFAVDGEIVKHYRDR